MCIRFCQASLTSFVVFLVSIANTGAARAQEASDSSPAVSYEEPFVCGVEDDRFTAQRRVQGQRNPLTLGEYPVLVMLINFEYDPDCDDPRCEDCRQPEEFVEGIPPGAQDEQDITTTEEAYGIFWGNDDIDPDYLSVSDYFDEVSYGRMQLIGDVAGDEENPDHDYYTLDIDLCSCSDDSCEINPALYTVIKVAAVTEAEADGWDVHMLGTMVVSDTYEMVVLAFPWYGQGCTCATYDAIFQHALRHGTSVHELGHTIGLGHASSWNCGDQVWGSDDTCDTTEYGNCFDVMGCSGYRGHFNAPHKQLLGWLDDETQVLTLTDSSDDGIYFLMPLEVAGDNVIDNVAAALRIPRGDEYYYFEFRQPLGFDEFAYNRHREIHPDYFGEDGFDGLMVNRGDSSPYQTFLLDMTPNSYPNDSSYDFLDGVLLVGQTYIDLVVGFSITPVSIVNGGTVDATLEVEVRFSPIDEVDLGPDRTIIYGDSVTFEPQITGGTPPYDCTWTPPDGLDDPTSCIAVTATPLETTTYTIEVHDSEPDSIPRSAQVEVEVIINDCNDNGIPDGCDINCGSSGGPCDLEGCGGFPDCQPNGVPDDCDLADGTSQDRNGNGIPDLCDPHRTIYVDDVTNPDGDGTHANPYDTIAEAIDDSISGDTILVMDGVYTGTGNIDLDFDGRVITVRSRFGPENCIIDCAGSGRAFTFDDKEDADAIVDGFTIINGFADQGGAIYLGDEVQATIRNCIIKGNTAQTGGGIYAYWSSPTISNCKITGNTATEDGGGLAYIGNGQVVPPYPSIRNCIISGNLADHGGGLAFDGTKSTIWQIYNCTITGNRAASFGGGIYCNANNPTLQNCILWGDEAPTGPEIAITLVRGVRIPETLTLTVDYSDVEGGMESVDDDPDDFAYLDWGEHNIDADPQFIELGYWDNNGTPLDPTDDLWVEGNYHLMSGSPCIDAGNNDVVEPGETDFDGEPRRIEDPDTPDTGNGDAPLVDMGADEFNPDCLRIVSSNPPDGAIDARQPFTVLSGRSRPATDGARRKTLGEIGPAGPINPVSTEIVEGPPPQMRQGWRSIELTFNGDVSELTPADFELSEIGGSGGVPTVVSLEVIEDQTVKLHFSEIIEPVAWTVVTHKCSGTSVRLGYLPADVDGSGVSNGLDILTLIDYLNGEGELPIWSTDINRDGSTDWADVQRLIELLKGNGPYPSYNGVALP